MSPLNFRWAHLSVFITFSCLDFCCILVRICVKILYEQVIPAHRFWSQLTWNIEIEVAKKRNKKKGGQHLAFKRGFWENFTRA